MTVNPNLMAARLSKFKIGDLALRSAFELERARGGAPHDRRALKDLADALRQSSGKEDVRGRVAHMRPGFFEPFEQLYRLRVSAEPESMEQIRDFVDELIDKLDAASEAQKPEDADEKLVDLCLSLHREFVRRQSAEGRFGRSQRSSIPVEALVG